MSITNRSAIGEARRAATRMATDLGFGETQIGKLAIVAAEAATNLVMHAQQGRMLLQALRRDDQDWIELITVDAGPGIADVGAALRDGFSTAGTAGQGLGAISRLSELFDIYSLPGVGTAVLARVRGTPALTKLACGASERLLVGAVNTPMPGENVCGDSWAVSLGPDRVVMMLVDGLGHGPQASDAAVEARMVFVENASRSVVEILELAHRALRKTRGAAMAITELDVPRRVARFAGVGNIAGTIFSAESTRGMVSYSGIVGREIRKLQEFTYPFPPGAIAMMHSDGIASRCTVNTFPGLLQRHPSLLAGMVWREYMRGTDDATLVIAREE